MFCGAVLKNASVCVAPDLPLLVLFRYWHTRLKTWTFDARKQDVRNESLDTNRSEISDLLPKNFDHA